MIYILIINSFNKLISIFELLKGESILVLIGKKQNQNQIKRSQLRVDFY